MENLKKIKLFLLDMDGTIYLDNDLFDGVTDFLEYIKPDLSLISCGEGNSYGHPHKETLERLENAGSRILSTKESGQLTLKIRKKKVEVVEYKETK